VLKECVDLTGKVDVYKEKFYLFLVDQVIEHVILHEHMQVPVAH